MKKYLLIVLCLSLSFVASAKKVKLTQGKTTEKKYFADIDFEWVGGWMVVPVEIKGKEYNFLFDTGSMNAISQEVYDQIGGSVYQSIELEDGQDTIATAQMGVIDSLELGSVQFVNQATAVADFNQDPVRACLGIDGVIGGNLMHNSVLQIDPENQKIYITNKDKNLKLRPKNGVAFFLTKQMVGHVTSAVGSKKTVDYMLINTGFNGAYNLSQDTYKQILEKNKTTLTVMGEGLDGVGYGLYGHANRIQRTQIGRIDELKFNGFTIKDPTFTTTPYPYSIVGMDVLRHGVLTIDYTVKRLYFDAYNEVYQADRKVFPFSVKVVNGDIVVGNVWNTQLEGQLESGDVIQAIDGVRADLCSIVTMQRSSTKSDFMIEVKHRDGSVNEIRIQKQTSFEN